MNPPIIIVDIWDGSHLFVDLVNSRETEVVINWTSSYESEKYSGVAKPPSDGFFVIPPGERLFCFPAADLNGQISAPGERFQKAMFGRPETTIEITTLTDSGRAELSKIINPSDLRVFGSVSFPAGKKAVGFECTEILFRNPVFIGKFTALGRTPWAQIDGTRFGDSCPAVNESRFICSSQDYKTDVAETDPVSHYVLGETVFTDQIPVEVLPQYGQTKTGSYFERDLAGMAGITKEEFQNIIRPGIISFS
jgi:hypothetical protein